MQFDYEAVSRSIHGIIRRWTCLHDRIYQQPEDARDTVFFCQPCKAVERNACQTLERCIELFGKPRGKSTLPGNYFCTLVFSSCETKVGRVVLHYNTVPTNVEVVFFSLFFFRASVGVKSWRKIKKPKCTSRSKRKNRKMPFTFVGIVMNNPARFRILRPCLINKN